MGYLFKNKTNIWLFILLILCSAGLVFALFYMDTGSYKAIDYSGMNETEVTEWMNNRNISEYSFEYEYSDVVPEGYVIKQSVASGKEFIKIVLTVSKGKEVIKEVALPEVTDELTREILEKFFSENEFTDVSFEYMVSDKPKDTVIKINLSGSVKVDTLVLVTLSAGEDASSTVISVPDFSDYTIAEAEAWAKANSITLKIDYNVSDTVAKGKILSQSVLKNAEIHAGDTIKVVVSDGKGIVIPDFSTMKKTDVEKWVKENNISNITYTESYSDTIEKGFVISNKPKTGVTISSDYPVSVVISKGKKIEVKSGYEGKSISDLEKYIKSLNSTVSVKDGKERFYSEAYTKDTVYSYTTGTVEDNDVILYSLSLGKYTPTAGEYEGLTKTKANDLIASYTAKKASVTLKLNDTETTDSNKIGITYGCSVSGNSVTCSLGVKSIPQINATDYNGITESSAKAKMAEYKKSYSEGTISFTYGNESNENKGKTYDCSVTGKNTVSCKLYREPFNVPSLDGKTKNDAQNSVNSYNSTYSTSFTISFTDVNTNEQEANKTYGCALSGNVVSCNFAKAVQMADIMEISTYQSLCLTSSTYDETVSMIQSYLGDFTNLSIVGVSSTKQVGQIVHITVNGTKDSYEGGQYPADTTVIVVEICNNRLN